MKYRAIVLVMAIMSGCASVADIQKSCEQSTVGFVAMASCLKSRSATDPQFPTSGAAKLYVLTAERLAVRVSSGEMSDLDARIALQNAYISMRKQLADERRASSASADSLMYSGAQLMQNNQPQMIYQPAPTYQQPTRTVCRQVFDTIQCEAW